MVDEKVSTSLFNLLVKHKIPFNTWGLNATKNFAALYKEVQSGEAVLVSHFDGTLHRHIRVALIDVFFSHHNSNRVYHLVEEKQVFSNGTVRVRQKASSIGEKLLQNEEPGEAAVMRALKEELKITRPVKIMKAGESITFARSTSYPGLYTNSTNYRYLVFLKLSQFNPDGYVEHQADITTYFKWEKYDIHDDFITLVNKKADEG